MRRIDYPGELILLSAFAGAIAAPIKLLVHHFFVWPGLAKPFYMELTAYLIHGHMTTEGIIEFLFGEIGDMSIGALFGVILGFWLKISRKKYHLWISLGYGIGIWFFSLFFGNLTKLLNPEMTDPWSLFAHLVAMLTYSILFFIATKIWKPLRIRINNSSRNSVMTTDGQQQQSLRRFYYISTKKDKDQSHLVKPKKL